MDTVQRIMEGTRGRTQSLSKERKSTGKGKDGEDGSTVPVRGADDYNARAVRHSIRVFVATGALMKLWGVVSARVMGKKKEYAKASPSPSDSRGGC